ncbi:MAG: hypothetical protein AAGI38_02750 [Bacteroidota bacterium]
MKINPLYVKRTACIVLAAFALIGCVRDKCDMEYNYMEYSPMYMSRSDFLNAVKTEAPRNLENPGKIYVYGDLLLVNEVAKGVHIFDNQNPEAPVALSFLAVPGNYDISVKCDHLYLDSSTDLLVFNLTNPSAPVLTQRLTNALPNLTYFRGYQADPDLGVVVGWRGEMKTGKFSCEDGGLSTIIEMNRVEPSQVDNPSVAGGPRTRGINPAANGKAGSTSRFAIQNDHLYVAQPQELKVLSLADCSAPVEVREIPVQLMGGEVETIFPLDDKLFLGSTTGMFIYDARNPSNPQLLSTFEHATACDPVVADQNYAYVTLRTADRFQCPGFTNQLDVIDVRQPSNPQLVRSYPMAAPEGLGIDGKLLFICDGPSGLKVYDRSNPQDIDENMIASFASILAKDVIPNNGVLIASASQGIFQYDYSNPQDIRQLSLIPADQ